MADMADRVERLTNLLALLLETQQPLPLRRIRTELAGQYPENDKAARQAFERDKAALRGIGVPIEMTVVGGDEMSGQTQYWIDRSSYELDELDLADDEMRALQVAVATVRTDAGQDAIWKLGGSIGDERPPISAVLPDRPELPTIRAAVAARAPITFEYRDAERVVEPWGVLLRGGFWYLVGHDHLRGEKRTFRVDRIVGDIATGEPGAFERPADFDPRDAFPADPKQIGHAAEDGVDAVVEVSAVRAGAIARELGADRVIEHLDDGAIRVRVPATNLDAFRSWVLGLTDHAVVVGPPEIRAHIVEWIEASARVESAS
ncbi:putative proteasome accessory factor B [Ilumatobacter coccineus YM16-304]|uniref:Putative proteasome accessory factor B n=2 Tax=Ilumatobacter coccineus TaxID=467094 RepID=A0A6C7EAY5_ILUCY|nr:putative proteasome accessory factor B [Ilumatobacter coccineus YM16-304]